MGTSLPRSPAVKVLIQVLPTSRNHPGRNKGKGKDLNSGSVSKRMHEDRSHSLTVRRSDSIDRRQARRIIANVNDNAHLFDFDHSVDLGKRVKYAVS